MNPAHRKTDGRASIEKDNKMDETTQSSVSNEELVAYEAAVLRAVNETKAAAAIAKKATDKIITSKIVVDDLVEDWTWALAGLVEAMKDENYRLKEENVALKERLRPRDPDREVSAVGELVLAERNNGGYSLVEMGSDGKWHPIDGKCLDAHPLIAWWQVPEAPKQEKGQ